MAFLSLWEIIQLVILTLAMGYIFSGFIQSPGTIRKRFDWESIKFAAIIATPAVVLHEFGHKFIAIAFGLDATFNIWGFGLLLGILLKAIGSPFLFLAPAYVSIPAGASAIQSAIIAFAGPGTNLLLFAISAYVLKTKTNLSEKKLIAWAISKKLNLFLFFFNLIPIPPLDGFHVLEALIVAF